MHVNSSTCLSGDCTQHTNVVCTLQLFLTDMYLETTCTIGTYIYPECEQKYSYMLCKFTNFKNLILFDNDNEVIRISK